MAANDTLGLNQVFQIYNEDGSEYEGLVMHKSATDSVVMSLGDSITGDVYWINNELELTMHEYITYNGVNYVLVNPPTIVREGMVSDNSELKGMTKYSFKFYHPMYQLGNFPFSDVAVTNDQKRYLSENKTFSWIGTANDYLSKLNKNLEGTQWKVEMSSKFPDAKKTEMSEVLSFDKNTIAEALKVAYETWGVPYVVDVVKSGEAGYDSPDNKRFKVVWGLPSNEIYESAAKKQQGTPYIFKMGQGVGLKNNSRTPRNNKIITRIAGYGSENNIPYGYPQIVWTGNQSWDYTINNNPSATNSYPIYDGIVGGQKVRLIKHPFTRTHLMPNVYVESVNKKVNPNATGYNPNIELKDYYDATAGGDYPNPINAQSPSYDIHEFEDIKPELGNESITAVTPLNPDLTPASSWDDTMDDDGNYIQSYFQITLPTLSFDIYACAAITESMEINMRSGACLGCTFPVEVDWEDYKANFYNEDGEFDPIIHTQEDDGHVRNGKKYPDSSNSSTPVKLILKKENTTFGTLMPNTYQHPLAGDQFVVLGISLPTSYITSAQTRLDNAMKSYMLENNVYYYDYPLKFDEAFLRNNTYILEQLKPNAIVRFEFAGQQLQLFVKQMNVKFGDGVLPKYDITLTDNIDVVLNQIGQVADDVEKLSTLISILRQSYGSNAMVELTKKLSKVDDDTAQGFIRFLKGFQVGSEFESAPFGFGKGGIFRKDADGTTYIEADKLYIRMKAYFDSVEVRRFMHSGGNRIASAAGVKCSRVAYMAWYATDEEFVEVDKNGTYKRKDINGDEETVATGLTISYIRCFFRGEDDDTIVTNDFEIGDQAYCHVTNETLNTHHYWRLVVRTDGGTLTDDGEHWIDLSNASVEHLIIDGEDYYHDGYQKTTEEGDPFVNDLPVAQDSIIQLGHICDKTRQGAIIEYTTGENAPSYKIYQGIDDFVLNAQNYISLGYNSQTGRAYMNVYGDAYIGDPDGRTFIKYEQEDSQTHQPKMTIKAVVEFQSPDDPTQTTTLEQFASEVVGDIENIQSQIDGQIETWFYDGAPTLNNLPASQWTTASEKKNHLGDLYYDNLTGYGYRFANTGTEQSPVFEWLRITDVDVVKALADAAKAQDTADHKRRVFLTQPVPPYDAGDLWSDATYPANNTEKDAGNNKYYKDLLTCKTAKAEGGSFSILDWGLTTNYTDDTALTNFVTNTYAPFVTNIQGQVDQKSETWYQDNDPSGSWNTTGKKEAHVGDIWCDTSQNGGKKTYIWQDRGEGTSPRFYWAEQAVPDDVFDKIDGKADIFVSKPTTYNRNDLWIIESGIAAADIPSGCQVGDIVIADNMPSGTNSRGSYIKGDWRKKDRYTDDTKIDNLLSNEYVTLLTQGTLSEAIENAQDAAESAQGTADAANAAAAALGYLSQALESDTQIVGGLVLSSLIGLRDANGTLWSGISGTYMEQETGTGYKGHGIAAWYGGGQVDHEVSSSASGYAKSLFRFDGSGYLAGGNITWDKDGIVTIANVYADVNGVNTSLSGSLQTLTDLSNALPLTIVSGTTYLDPQYSFKQLSVLGKTVATQEWANGRFLTIQAFERLFNALNSSGTKVSHPYSSTVASIKAMFGLWTDQYLSAKGINPQQSGGGGVGDVTWDLLASSSDTHQIALSHLTDALANYATQSWVNSQGFLKTHQTLYTLSVYGNTTKVLGFKPNANASLYIKAGGDISLANDTTNHYITLSYSHPTDGANTTISAASGKVLSAITVNSLGHVTSVSSKTLAAADIPNLAASKITSGTFAAARIPDLSATYAKSERVTTLEGYFTDGVANSAAMLSDETAYKAWGQTFFTGGLPTNVTGNMSGVGTITFNGANAPDNFTLFTAKMATNDGFRIVVGGSTSDSGYAELATYDNGNEPIYVRQYGASNVLKNSMTLLDASGNTVVNNLIATSYIKIGDIYIGFDSNNQALEVYKLNGSTHVAANFYALGAMSAKGSNSQSGGGGGTGDVTWDLLANNSDTRPIALSHLTTALSNYLTQSAGDARYLRLIGGTVTGNVFIKGAHDLSQANNGITDNNNRYYGFYIKDKNDKRSAQYINRVSPNGSNCFWMSVTYDVSGASEVDRCFGLSVDKQGNCTWTVDGAAAFRTAIGIDLANLVTINTAQTITASKVFNDLRIGNQRPWYFYSENETEGVVSTEALFFSSISGGKNFYFIDQFGNKLMRFYAGDSNQQLKGGLYFPSGLETAGQIKSTVATGTKPFNVSSTTLCDNLNADMLDGKHGNEYALSSALDNYLPLSGGTLSNTSRQVLSIKQTGDSPEGPYIAFKMNSSDLGYLGYNTSSGFFMQNAVAGKTLRIHTDGTLQFGGNKVLDASNTYVSSGKGYIDSTEITTITGNAATATALKTSRTLWGQSFDGTANVTGSLTNVTDITMTGYLRSAYYLTSHEAAASTDAQALEGWVKIASITINQAYINWPLRFRVAQRGLLIGEITLLFSSVSDKTNTSVREFFYTGSIKAAKISGSGTSWNLYIQKTEKWDSIGITLTDLLPYKRGTITIAWTYEIVTSEPSGTAASCRLYISKDIYLELDSANSGVHLVGGGLYADTYISAMGANSISGGGGGTLYLLNDVKPDSDSTPTRVYGLNGTATDNGKVLMYNHSLTKWVAGTVAATDTKNTAGINRSNNTTLYLVGSTTYGTNSVSDYGVTLTSSLCYIGSDNCLYSNGYKVLSSAGGTVTGYIYQKFDSVERGVTVANNVYRSVQAIDKNSKFLTKMETGVLTNGQTRINLWVAGNKNASVADEYGGFQIYKTVGVDGNATMTFDANAGICNATCFRGEHQSIYGNFLRAALKADGEGGALILRSSDGYTYYTDNAGSTEPQRWEMDAYQGDWRWWTYIGGSSTSKSASSTILRLSRTSGNVFAGYSIIAGEAVSTTEHQLVVQSKNSGNLYLFANSNGKGLYTSTVGDGQTALAKSIISVTKDNTTVTFYGNLSGTASLATSASWLTAIDVKYPDSVTGNTVGYELIGRATIAPEYKRGNLVFSVASRHDGSGIVSIIYGCEKDTANFTVANAFCDIRFFGTTLNSSDADGFFCHAIQSGSNIVFSFFWRNRDYSPARVRLIESKGDGAFTPSSVAWMTTVDESTYGTKIAQMQRNVSDSATKLATARTLWGQSFNGTGNISGKITIGTAGTATTASLLELWSSVSGAISWVASFRNTHHVESNDGHGVGIKLALGADTESSKWWGIAAITASTWENKRDLVFINGYETQRELLRISHEGNMGIGTAAPTQKLDVNGNVKINGSLTGCTSIDSLMHFDTTNGYVGIGTSSPNYHLDVLGQIRCRNNSTGNQQLSFGCYSDSNNPYIRMTDANGSYVDALSISNVGSTESPLYALKVGQSDRQIRIMGINVRMYTKTSADTNTYGLGFVVGYGGRVLLGSSTSLLSNNTDCRAVVDGVIGVDGVKFYGENGVTMDSNGNIIHKTTTSGNYWHIDTNGGTAIMAITTGGKVGIGETSPATKLHVVGGSGVDAVKFVSASDADPLVLDTTRSYNVIRYLLNGSFKWRVGCNTNMFYFWSSSSVFNILNGGNVGIGTTSPYTKLDVNGGVKATKVYLYKPNSGNDTNAVYFECDSDHNVKLNGNFYATGAVSALGANTASGGSSVIDLGNVETNILPSSSGSYGIGSDSKRWKIYATTGNFNGALSANGSLAVTGTSALTGAVVAGSTLKVTTRASINQEINNNYRLAVTGHISVMSGGVFIGEDGQVSLTHKLYVKDGTSYLNGNVGIGGYNANYKLYVNGNSYLNGNTSFGGANTSNLEFDMHKNKIVLGNIFLRSVGDTVYFDASEADEGYVRGYGGCTIVSGSDIRQKDVVSVAECSLEDVACAPIFNFTWKSTKKKVLHLGTSAQYWRNIFPYSTPLLDDGFYSMDYGATALAAAVITARKVVDHERRIRLLEVENEALRNEIEQLKKVA